MIMEVTVLFFGVLTEVTQTGLKIYHDVETLGNLILKIKDDFPEIVNYNYRISVNSVMVNDDPILKNGDEIAFMPPFAGG